MSSQTMIGLQRTRYGILKSGSRPLLPGFVVSLTAIGLVVGDYGLTDMVIRPATLNSRGFMGRGRMCPENEVAIGFKMKMHHHVPNDVGEIDSEEETSPTRGIPDEKLLDNTALNAIRLMCSGGTEVRSHEGKNGIWTEFLRCQGNGDHVVGARLRSERWQGWGIDDIGATNFEAICKSGARLLYRRDPSWINDRGKWGSVVTCPEQAPAVCGIKSRIDNADTREMYYAIPDIRGDRAGLTEIQLRCCRV